MMQRSFLSIYIGIYGHGIFAAFHYEILWIFLWSVSVFPMTFICFYFVLYFDILLCLHTESPWSNDHSTSYDQIHVLACQLPTPFLIPWNFYISQEKNSYICRTLKSNETLKSNGHAKVWWFAVKFSDMSYQSLMVCCQVQWYVALKSHSLLQSSVIIKMC